MRRVYTRLQFETWVFFFPRTKLTGLARYVSLRTPDYAVSKGAFDWSDLAALNLDQAGRAAREPSS